MINFFLRPLFFRHKKHTLYEDQPRRYIIHVLRLHVECPMVIKIEICRQISIKIPNMKLHESSSGWSPGFRCLERTDRHKDANSSFSQVFWERA